MSNLVRELQFHSPVCRSGTKFLGLMVLVVKYVAVLCVTGALCYVTRLTQKDCNSLAHKIVYISILIV